MANMPISYERKRILMSVSLGDINAAARSLAMIWGREFGHKSKKDFGITVTIMKSLLKGNGEIGVRPYTFSQIEATILWLANGVKRNNVAITSAGVLKYILPDFVAGKLVEETFLVKKKRHERTVRII